MKPRIRLKFGVWSCVSWRQDGDYLYAIGGYGYTREEAIEEWKAQASPT